MNIVTVPAGTYFLGDPCYAVPEQYWDAVLDVSDMFTNPEAEIEIENGKKFTIYAFSTAYGDGSYDGDDGHSYPVDSGLIGLVPVDLIEEELADWLGTYVTFDEDTDISSNGCRLIFGDVVIDTDPSEDDDYDEDSTWERGFDDEMGLENDD